MPPTLRSLAALGCLCGFLCGCLFGCAGANPARSLRDRLLTRDGPSVSPAPAALPASPRFAAQIALPNEAPAMIGGDPRQNQNAELTLANVMAIAMRNSDVVRVVSGGQVEAGESTSFDPAIAAAKLQAALAEFDVNFVSSFSTTRINQPPNAVFGPGLAEPTRRDEGLYNAGLQKRTLTGGQVGVSFNPAPGYLFLPGSTTSSFNPLYQGNLEFAVRQPLLRGAGPEVTRAPVRIAQMKVEQSTWEFKKELMENLRDVNQTYWDLDAARFALQAIEEVIPLMEELVRLQEANFKAQWVVRADVAKAIAQLHQYRQQRVALRSTILETELRLRNLLRLPPADGWNLIPVTPPTKAPFRFDPADTLAVAYANHPDLLRQRINVRISELQWTVARNGLQPQFDLQALYRLNGIGEDVGGALEQLADAEFSDWELGATFSVPLGRRQATAQERGAELEFARQRALLQQAAHATAHRLGNVVRELNFAFEQYQEAEAQFQAADEWLKGARLRYKNPIPANDGQNWLMQSVNDYLAAVRFRTDSAAEAARLLARYNSQIVALEEVKGTLLGFFEIELIDDPCGQVRLVPAAKFSAAPGAPFETHAADAAAFGRAAPTPPVRHPLATPGF